MLGVWVKVFKVCRYAFLFIWKLQVKKVCQKYLLYTSAVMSITMYYMDSQSLLSLLPEAAIGKSVFWSLFLIKSPAFRPATLFKTDSNKGVFLGILRIFLKNLFWKSSASTVSVFHFIPLRYSPASLEWVFEQKSYPFHISYLLSSIYLYAKIMQK